jgi:hypothetical protein
MQAILSVTCIIRRQMDSHDLLHSWLRKLREVTIINGVLQREIDSMCINWKMIPSLCSFSLSQG